MQNPKFGEDHLQNLNDCSQYQGKYLCQISPNIHPQQQHLFYGHYAGQPALAGTPSEVLEDFVVAVLLPNALADGN